jgi:hypothetical protein
VFNNYNKFNHFILCIDSTGSIALKEEISGRRPSSKLQFYVGVISVKGHSTPVLQMVSERHSANAISFWLKEWIRSGATVPNEVVCDFSTALLAAIIQAFSEYNTIKDYINQCLKFLRQSSALLPKYFLRIDVAHFIKMICRWKCFSQEKHRAVKDFYVRCVIVLMHCTKLNELLNVLTAIFWSALCETVGTDDNGNKVQSEISREWLVKKISKCDTAVPDEILRNDNEIADIDVSLADIEDSFPEINEIYQSIEALLGNGNGNRVNSYFLPEFAKSLRKVCMSAPLWSALLQNSFSSKQNATINVTASSAGVESYFRDLKTLLFTPSELPLRVDEFVLRHISHLCGCIKIASAAVTALSQSLNAPDEQHKETGSCEVLDRCYEVGEEGDQEDDDVEPDEPIIPDVETMLRESFKAQPDCESDQHDTEADEERSEMPQEVTGAQVIDCVACRNGDYPTGAHKCMLCSKSVHILPGCSVAILGEEEGYGEGRHCHSCEYKLLQQSKSKLTESTGIGTHEEGTDKGIPSYH